MVIKISRYEAFTDEVLMYYGMKTIKCQIAWQALLNNGKFSLNTIVTDKQEKIITLIVCFLL